MPLKWVSIIALLATLFMFLLIFMSYTANGQPVTIPSPMPQAPATYVAP